MPEFRAMRVLLAHNSLYYPSHGGGDKSNRLLMEALAARGHQCRVVARLASVEPGAAGLLCRELEARGVAAAPAGGAVVFTLHGVEVHVAAEQTNIRAYFTGQIAAFQPDVILTSTDDPAQLLLEAALRAEEARVVYLARATIAVPFGPDCAFPSPSKTETLRQVDGVVGVSRYVAGYLRRWGGLDAVHVPISLMEPGEFPHLGRFDNEFVTLVNPCAVKGIAIFLELAARLPGVPFAAVPTWGTNRRDYEALRRHSNIHILDPVDDVNKLFARTKVLLVPSLWAEARSRIIPEAMLRGVPVLAAEVGGIPEAMLGVDYLLPVRPIAGYRHQVDEHMVPEAEVPEQDVGPWLAALSTLLADRRRYEELSALSRRRAHEYLASLSVEPFEQYLSEVCSRPRKARESRPPSSGAPGLAGLSAEKRRLLALRVKQRASGVRPEDAWFPGAAAGAGARLRLFCFPYAGAGTAAFRGWNDQLPGGVHVCPARLPGRESRLGETPFRQMEPLVAALAEAIAPRLDRPFAFFGHSMGAAIAFELARALRRSGKPLPAALVVSGARAPRFRLGHVPPPEPLEEDFLKELERLEGLPSEVREHPELLRVVLPALRADTALYRAYVYTEAAPLAMPVFAYGGRNDPNIRPEHLEAWAGETTADFKLRWFDGGHFFIDTARREFLEALAGDLRALLS